MALIDTIRKLFQSRTFEPSQAKQIGDAFALMIAGSGGGDAVSKSITQAAHGFSVGMPIHLNGSTWEQADRDDATKACDAVVSAVASANAFTALLSGWVTLTTGEWDARTGDAGGLTAGEYYWLSSTAGGLVKTKPTTGLVQLVMVAASTTVAVVMVGDIVDGTPTIALTDGDKGDITVSASGAAFTIDAGVVTLAKMADMATDSIIGRATAATGVPQVLTALPFAYTGDVTRPADSNVQTIPAGTVTLAKQADVATATVFYRKTAGTGVPEVQTLATLKTDLLLTGTNSGDQTTIVGITGTLAEFNAALTGADFATGGGTITGTSTGTNTGDQTSIVGITGTKAQFDTAVTDGNILYVGDVTQYTDEMAQDAVGAMVDASLTYVDATPLLQRAALTGAITATAGSNATVLGSFTIAQLNTAVNDADVSQTGHTHTLANVSDVTMTVANLNILDDGVNTALHFHNADRARAVHTGTQLAATISDLAATVQAYTLDTFADPVASVDFAQQQALRFRIENRTSDPGAPLDGEIWLRTDL